MRFERKKGKSQQIAERIETEIVSGKLQPGSRMKSVREIAENFSVSLCSVQVAMEALEEKGLIERKRGSGTFIREHNMTRDNTVYFLVPSAAHITLKYDTSIMLRRLLYGATYSALPGQLVQPIAVCKSDIPDLSKNPEAIDWVTLKRIPPGGNVFISSLWYREIIPFLAERSVRGVFLASQYEQEYPETCKIIQEAGWDIITLDRFTAIQRTVEYLHLLGKNRIAAIKHYENEPGHPFRRGFIAGYKKRNIPFNDDFFKECSSEKLETIENIILELREKTEFDALILCIPDLINQVFNVLTKKIGLKIPEDAAIISFGDIPEYLELSPQISAFDFPWVDVGTEIINIFNSKSQSLKDTRFHASIIERASTVKGLTGPLLQTFMPEVAPVGRKIPELT